jgi:hypothetical protein
MAGYGKAGMGELGLVIDAFLEIAKLSLREHHEKGLKQHDRFPEAGIEVVVARVYLMPATLRVGTLPLGKIVGDGAKVPVQIFHHFLQGTDFMKELKPVGKEYPV